MPSENNRTRETILQRLRIRPQPRISPPRPRIGDAQQHQRSLIDSPTGVEKFPYGEGNKIKNRRGKKKYRTRKKKYRTHKKKYIQNKLRKKSSKRKRRKGQIR